MRSALCSRRARASRALWLCIVASLLFASTAGAQADERTEAKERFARGVERMEAEDWAGAVAEFQRAYKLAPVAVILFNMGIAYENLDRPVEAVDAMTKVVDNPGNLKPERLERAKKSIAEQKKRIGRIVVVAEPADASVRIDGLAIDKGAGSTAVRAGNHFVEVTKTGYAPARKEVAVAGQDEVKVQVTLEATELAFAQLWVKSSLPGADIYLDNVRIGTTPLTQSVPVLPGSHAVELRRPGYRTLSKTVELGPGATGEARLDPEADSGELGKEGGMLILASDAPDDLVLEIDGKRHGVYTGPIELVSGPHDVRVERAGFLPVNLQVSIARGDRTTREVVMDPTAETVADHNGSVALFRGLGWSFAAVGALAIGGGAIFFVLNEDNIDELDAEFTPQLGSGLRCDALGGNYDENYCVDLATRIDGARGRRPIAYVLFGVGGAAFVTGVALLIAGPDADKYHPDTDSDALDELALTPLAVPLEGGGMVGLAGRF